MTRSTLAIAERKEDQQDSWGTDRSLQTREIKGVPPNACKASKPEILNDPDNGRVLSYSPCAGYPSLENAVESANRHADGYLIKPVDIDELLNRIRICLKRQEEAAEYYEQKVKEFIERRTRKRAS